jgi:formylglycine-generating enzyme required for sulfatase activity
LKPVENVSWEDVQHFIEKNHQLKLRLPTEAEWENACRAGTETAFHFDSDIALDQVNYRGTWDDNENWGEGALQQTAEVKRYPPNAWGLYEMHGNVWEWCQDWYGDYPSEPVVDPQGRDTPLCQDSCRL